MSEPSWNTSFKLPEGFSERLQRQGLQKKNITDHSGQLRPPLPPKLWQFGYYLIHLKVSVGRDVEDTGCEQHSQGGVNWLLWDLWGHVDFCTIRCQGTPSLGWPWLGYLGCCSLDKKSIFQNELSLTTSFGKHIWHYTQMEAANCAEV